VGEKWKVVVKMCMQFNLEVVTTVGRKCIPETVEKVVGEFTGEVGEKCEVVVKMGVQFNWEVVATVSGNLLYNFNQFVTTPW
jgi:hypothetical protein